MKDEEANVAGPAELPETANQPARDLQSGAGKSSHTLSAGEWILVALSYLLIFLTFPFSLWLCLKIVNEFEQAIVLRLGHLRKGEPLGPGVYFLLPCTDRIIRVDMRTKATYIPIQEIISKDPLVLDVDGVIYYRVQDPTLVVTSITSADEATKLLAQTTLRNILGTMYLSQLICNREKVAQSIQTTVNETTSNWGIMVELIEIKNVRTRIKVVPPSEQTPAGQSSKPSAPRIMKEASIVVSNNPVSFQFRCLTKETQEVPNVSPQGPSIVFSYP